MKSKRASTVDQQTTPVNALARTVDQQTIKQPKADYSKADYS